MAGQTVEFPSNSGTCEGYLAIPESGSGPGVIVIQEWWGLVDHIKDVCNRFANEGFVALAPDLYHGETTSSPDDAGKLMMALNIDKTEKDLRGAITYLLNRPETTSEKVGTVGFCMGGQLSLFAACQNAQVGACVVYYGIHPEVNPHIANLQAPVLAFFGENDTIASPDKARALEKQIQDENKQIDLTIYDGVEHAFFNDTRPEVYNEEAAKDSWNRMLKFFREQLS